MKATGCRLYVITPERFDLHVFPSLLAQALDAGEIAAVQLRLKNVDDDTWKRAIEALRPLCQTRDVKFLLNDRADLVEATGSDGVHVGQEDMPAPAARRLMSPGRTLGVTCKSSIHAHGRVPSPHGEAVARLGHDRSRCMPRARESR